MASLAGSQLATGPVLVPFRAAPAGVYAVPQPRSPLITVPALAVTAAAARTANGVAAPRGTCVVYVAALAGPAIALIAMITATAGMATQRRTWRSRWYMWPSYGPQLVPRSAARRVLRPPC